ncbi:Nucleoside-triphosphatase [Candidatus Arthromitus sp. SFB-2]|nr:Nucleoside-triphosphatase [Candidatus Arthromitus sp. SFB-2]
MIIASNNVNKVREIREIFNDLDFDIVSLKDEDIFINVVENRQYNP